MTASPLRAMRKRPLSELPPGQRAGILCNQPTLDAFVLDRDATCPNAATYVREQCGVTSRRLLDTDPEAAERWQRLVTEYDAWRGKIGQPT